MSKFCNQIKAFWQEEDGLSAVEYVVAGSLLFAGLALVFTNLGNAITNGVTNLTNSIS